MAAFSVNDLRTMTKVAPGTANAASPGRSEVQAPAELAVRYMPRSKLSPLVIEGLYWAFEFFTMLVAGIVTYVSAVVPETDPVFTTFLAVPLLSSLVLIIAQASKPLRMNAFRSPGRYGVRLLLAWVCVFVLAFAVCAVLPVGGASGLHWLTYWGVAGFMALAVERVCLVAVTNYLSRSGKLARRAAIVGGGPAAERLLQELAQQDSDDDIHIVGIFDDRMDDRSPDVVAGFPKLGNVDDLVGFARHTQLDLVIFVLPISAEQRLLLMLQKLWVLPMDIRLAAHTNKLRFRPRAYSYVGGVPVIDLFDKPIADWDFVVKTFFDKVVGLFCLIMALPVMVLVALAVKIDTPGPILFRQQRYGFNNERIEVFKFRSMFVNTLDFNATKLVTRADPRVTRVGRFIRKTSLDELPQLLNVVFKGNLSLVGPRPHAVHAKAANFLYDEVVDGYFARHRVRPGITGWAQINGWRGETDTQEKIQNRVEHDLYYIENWSILFDIYVLAVTPFALLKSNNAY